MDVNIRVLEILHRKVAEALGELKQLFRNEATPEGYQEYQRLTISVLAYVDLLEDAERNLLGYTPRAVMLWWLLEEIAALLNSDRNTFAFMFEAEDRCYINAGEILRLQKKKSDFLIASLSA